MRLATYLAAVVVGALGATYASVPLYKLFCQATGFGGTTQRVQSGTSTTTNEDDDDTYTYTPSSTSFSDKMRNALHDWTKFVRKTTTTTSPIRRSPNVHTWTDEDAAQRLATLQPVPNAQLITVRMDSTVGDVLPWTFTPTQRHVKVVPGETALTFFRVTNHADHAIVGVATYNVYPPKMGLYFNKIQCFCFEEQRVLAGETVDMPVFFFIDPDVLNDGQMATLTDMTLSYTFFPTDMEDDDDDDDDEAEEEAEVTTKKVYA
jgi:cytochrome c oxidase assembly protein subunit 11